METLISHEIFGSHITAFFTGKSPGADIDKIARIASVSKENIYLPIQKHTDKILLLDSDFSPKIADAVITRTRGIFIGVQVADCVPVLLCDIKKSVLGVVHAGWRGTAAGILKKTISEMCDKFSSDAEDIKVALGPGIRWCCYNVGYDVFESVERASGKGQYHIQKGETLCLDLSNANKYQAISSGIPEENIWMSGECTYCNPDRFYSYRYSKGSTGRQGGFIGILK